MQKQIKWQTKAGGQASVIVALRTNKTVWADGVAIKKDCCEMIIEAWVDDHIVGQGRPRAHSHLPDSYVSHIGKLAISAEHTYEIELAIAEIEATPAWQERLAKIESAIRDAEDYEAHCVAMSNAMDL